jgi:hypothetical protein
MTGEALWAIFFTVTIPEKNLKVLANDLYNARRPPCPESRIAVQILSQKLAMDPDHVYEAFNIGPAAPTLRTMADELRTMKPWAATATTTKNYLAKVAHRIDVIQKATGGGSAGTPASVSRSNVAPAAPAFQAQAAKTMRRSIATLVIGGIVYFLVGFSQYAKIPRFWRSLGKMA